MFVVSNDKKFEKTKKYSKNELSMAVMTVLPTVDMLDFFSSLDNKKVIEIGKKNKSIFIMKVA